MSRPAALLAAAALLAGCDLTLPWSGESVSVDVSPRSLTFGAIVGRALPASRTLDVRWEGVTLVAGFPPGVTAPEWLDVGLTSSSQGRATVRLSVTTTALPRATYTTTVRLVTGDSAGEKTEHRDVPVTYQLGNGLQASTPSVSLTAGASVASAPATVTLTSDLPGDT